MSRTSSKQQPPTGFPEFAVRRETISQFFDPPLPSSTFHDFVHKGIIVPVKGIRGFYRLNDSLRRLGLREVPRLPSEPATRTTDEIVRFAFHLIDPDLFPAPAWLLTVEALDPRDVDHAVLLVEKHAEALEALESVQEKLSYLQGVLDAHTLLAANPVPQAAHE